MNITKTTIIIFGITGDLAQKKILPALYDLYKTKRIDPGTRIVGFSRRPFTAEEIRTFVVNTIHEDTVDREFLDSITYVQGTFDDATSYNALATHLQNIDEEHGGCSNKLFYLSVPPTLYEMIATHLSQSGLSIPCGGADGFARILIEKPFGKDLETAQKLDELLGTLFNEEQIYRIDHYVAKKSLYNIIGLHRKDPYLTQKWNKEYIEKIEIHLYEKAVVGLRGASYDGVGALRDVGQNHMLQMLALVAMCIPEDSSPALIRTSRGKLLEHLLPISYTNSIDPIVKAQYDGYAKEPGVEVKSLTETFFKITAYLDVPEWSGVPFVLSSGKALSENMTEIKVYFKDGLTVGFTVPPEDSIPAYQKILLDCIAGDQTVFMSTKEILAEWRYISPIVQSWEHVPPTVYSIGARPENIQ